MWEQLEEIKSSLADLAGRLDYSSLLVREAEALVAAAAGIANVANTIRSRGAARIAAGQGGLPPTDPRRQERQEREAASKTAQLCGSSPSAGKAAVETGQRLQIQEGVSAAANAGELSLEMTQAISEAVETNPEAEQALLDLARSGASLGEVRQACAEAIAQAQTDPEEARRQIHAARCLRSWTDARGVWHLRADGLPTFGAAIDAAIAPLAEALWRRAKAEAHHGGEKGGPEPGEAYRFDALVALVQVGGEAQDHTPQPPRADSDEGTCPEPDEADGPDAAPERGGGGSPARLRAALRRRGPPFALIVRVDYTALLRGSVEAGEVSDLVGYGPLDISSLRHLCSDGDPFVSAVVTQGRRVVGVANFGRRPNALQATALAWLYPTCAALGCPAPPTCRPTTGRTGPTPTSPAWRHSTDSVTNTTS